jgi:hypothetical protein
MKTKYNRKPCKQKSKTHRKKSFSGGSPFFDATSTDIPLKSFIPINPHNDDLLSNQTAARLNNIVKGGTGTRKNKSKSKKNRK